MSNELITSVIIKLEDNKYDSSSLLQLNVITESDVVMKLLESIPTLLVINYRNTTRKVQESDFDEQVYGVHNKFTGKLLISGLKTVQKRGNERPISTWALKVDKDDLAQALASMLLLRYPDAVVSREKEELNLAIDMFEGESFEYIWDDAMSRIRNDCETTRLENNTLREILETNDLNNFECCFRIDELLHGFNFEGLLDQYGRYNCMIIPTHNKEYVEKSGETEIKSFIEVIKIYAPSGVSGSIATIARTTRAKVNSAGDQSIRTSDVEEKIYLILPNLVKTDNIIAREFYMRIMGSQLPKKYVEITW